MFKTIRKLNNYLRWRYDRHYRERKIHLAIDIILASMVVVLIFFIMFIKFTDFSYKNRLSFDVSYDKDKIVSGQEVIFQIKYANTSKVNLEETKFSFNSPEGFILEEVSPDNFFHKKTNSFEIGHLIPGGNGAIKIKGIFIGAPGSSSEVILNVSYLLNGKLINELFSRKINIDLSSLKITCDNSGFLYRGQPTPISLTLKNISQFDLKDLELSFINSDISLNLEEDKNKVEKENNKLKIKQLKAGENLTIKFSVIYDGAGDKAEIKLVADASINGKKVNQADLTGIFVVKETDLSIKIKPDKQVVDIDDDIIYKITLKNSGDKSIDNLVLDLSANKPSHNLKSVKMANKPFIRLIGKQIIFDRSFKPGEAEDIEITAQFSRSEILINDAISIKAVAQYYINKDLLRGYYLSDISKIKTTDQFKAETRYFSVYGDQLGVGPIPPVAGIPTKYWIFWQLKNHGNKLADLQVSAELPAGVIWSNESSVNKGTLAFDDKKNMFTWQVDEVGSLDENCRLAFALTIIPNAANAKKKILLLNNIKYNFFDDFTRENIEKSFGDLTNDLSSDNYAFIIMDKN